MTAPSHTPHVLLLTGRPGSGKTTIMLKAARILERCALRGFITREIRADEGRGSRRGFMIQSLSGPGRVLAEVDSVSPVRVGRYGIYVAALDEIVELTLAPSPICGGYLIDEIGKMECSSERFVSAVRALLASRFVVIATVADHGGGLIEEVKRRKDATLWKVTRNNRNELSAAVAEWFRKNRHNI